MDVYHEIKMERELQDKQWGGPSHDDGHTPQDWCSFISERLVRVEGNVSHNGKGRRQQLIEIAALAVAAVEAHDRSRQVAV